MYFILLSACLSLSVPGCSGNPAKYGVGFSVGSSSRASVSSRAEATFEDGKLSGDVAGSASGGIDSHLRGGAYAGSNGEVIGVNGGLNSKIGGAVQGGLHGEIESKNGAISTSANSSLTSATVTGLSGHANIATGDDELRQIAEYEQGKIMERALTGHGSTTDLGALISLVANILENIWLYFWLTVGSIIILVCCCLVTVCCFYWKLVADVQSLKVQTEKALDQTYSEHKVDLCEPDSKY